MKVQSLSCPACGGAISAHDKFCVYCGTSVVIKDEKQVKLKLVQDQVIKVREEEITYSCPICGSHNLLHLTFDCVQCGAKHLCKTHLKGGVCDVCADANYQKWWMEKKRKERLFKRIITLFWLAVFGIIFLMVLYVLYMARLI